MAEILGVAPVNSSEVVLTELGSRLSRGSTLTMAEQNMAMTATATLTADRFGPSPANMQLPTLSLPEDVKGALAQFSA